MIEKRNVDKWGQIRGRFFDTPELQEEYEHAKRRMIFIRQMLMQIDAERERAGLSKAELARRIGASPSVVRRVFSSKTSNPTLRTVLDMLDALDIGLELKPRQRRRRPSSTPDRPHSASQGGASA